MTVNILAVLIFNIFNPGLRQTPIAAPAVSDSMFLTPHLLQNEGGRGFDNLEHIRSFRLAVNTLLYSPKCRNMNCSVLIHLLFSAIKM